MSDTIACLDKDKPSAGQSGVVAVVEDVVDDGAVALACTCSLSDNILVRPLTPCNSDNMACVERRAQSPR